MAPSRDGTRLQAASKSGLFDLAAFDRLPNVALAVWYAHQQQQRAGAFSSEAVVPVAIVKKAQTVRGRMLRVLEHYFDDDAEVGPRLVAVRSGGGLQDLANDLEQLSDLHEEDDVHAVISKDPKHWRADDVASARRFAQSIFPYENTIEAHSLDTVHEHSHNHEIVSFVRASGPWTGIRRLAEDATYRSSAAHADRSLFTNNEKGSAR